MPVPLAPHVTLTHDEQSRLESMVRAHSTPQALAFRCQVILRAAAPDHPSNLHVANALQCNRHRRLCSNGTDMRCSTYLFICGVYEYVELALLNV